MARDGEGYNGWTNYETWSVALIMDNDRSLYEQRCALAREIYDEAVPEWDWQSKQQAAEQRMVEWLKDYVEEKNPLNDPGYINDSEPLSYLYSQLLGAAISSVNWHEIARHWIEEAMQEQEAEA